MEEKESQVKPLFSIIVLSYMQRHFLKDCFNSIFAQTYPNIELVVCDDWSADFDVPEVERYIQDNKPENIRNVVVFRQERNVGIVQNAKKGVELSSGKYFKLHAADDMLYGQETIGNMAKLLNNSDACAVSARAVACMRDGALTEHYYPPNGGARDRLKQASADEQFVILGTMPAEECFHGAALFWKRKAFDAVGGFDMDYRYVDDLPLLLKLTKAGRRIYIADVVATVFRYGGILNRGFSGVHREFHTAYYREQMRVLQEIPLPAITASGNRKKLARCRYQIKRVEFRADIQPDWDNLSIWRKLLWRLHNMKFLLFAWLYHIRTVGLRTNKRVPLAAMAVSVLMFALHAEIWPGVQIDRFWALLFFAAVLWLVFCVVIEMGVKAMNHALSGRR